MSDDLCDHPSPEQLEAFDLGKLSSGEWSAVERHVLNCPTCWQRLEAVPDDALVRLLKAAKTIGTPHGDSSP